MCFKKRGVHSLALELTKHLKIGYPPRRCYVSFREGMTKKKLSIIVSHFTFYGQPQNYKPPLLFGKVTPFSKENVRSPWKTLFFLVFLNKKHFVERILSDLLVFKSQPFSSGLSLFTSTNMKLQVVHRALVAKKNRVFDDLVYPTKTNLDVQKLTDLSCLKNRKKKHQKIFKKKH